MTMSVGLARITVDSTVSNPLVRKMMGALSKPGLLVHDTGLSIDDDGRIIIKLSPESGLAQDETGLHMEEFVGIDSHVDLVSEEHDREWNARLTGTAPNFIEGSVAIGSEELGGIAEGVAALGLEVQDAKLNVTSTTTQLRLSHDIRNYMAAKVYSNGYTELFSVGSDSSVRSGFRLITGDGVLHVGDEGYGGLSINEGTEIETIATADISAVFAGGGVAGSINWEEVYFNISPTLLPWVNTVVAGGMRCEFGAPAQLLSWSVRMSADNQVAIRIAWFDVMAALATKIPLTFIRFKA